MSDGPRSGRGVMAISHTADFDQLANKADAWAAAATDAVIAGLKRLERDAISHAYLETRWVHPHPVEPILVVAVEGVRIGLRKKGVA